VACIVNPAPAEKPIIPILEVSMPHSLAFLTIKAEDMEELFCNSKFNQDLSAWPVLQLAKPLNFDSNCPLWYLPKPNWGGADTHSETEPKTN